MNALFVVLEIMDKEPSLAITVFLAVAGGVVGLVAGRRRAWLSVLPLVALLLFGASRVSALQDPFVGPAIRQEVGNAYAVFTYTALAVGIALCLVGALQG